MCFFELTHKIFKQVKNKLTRNNILNITVNFHDFPIKLNEEYL